MAPLFYCSRSAFYFSFEITIGVAVSGSILKSLLFCRPNRYFSFFSRSLPSYLRSGTELFRRYNGGITAVCIRGNGVLAGR